MEKFKNGGLDKKENESWKKSLIEFANSDGWLKAIIWTLVGGARTISLILGTYAYVVSTKDNLCLFVYLFFLTAISGLYQATDYFIKLREKIE